MNTDKKMKVIKEQLEIDEGKVVFLKKSNGGKFPRPVSYKKIFARLFPSQELEMPDSDPIVCSECGSKLILGKDNRYVCSNGNCGLENEELSIYDNLTSPDLTKTYKENKQINERDIEEIDAGQERNIY